MTLNGATDNQMRFLANKGIDASQWSFKAASEKISELKGNAPAAEKLPYQQPAKFVKKEFDTKSFYVAYAKDVCIALIAANPKLEVDKAMDLALLVIQKAKKSFE